MIWRWKRPSSLQALWIYDKKQRHQFLPSWHQDNQMAVVFLGEEWNFIDIWVSCCLRKTQVCSEIFSVFLGRPQKKWGRTRTWRIMWSGQKGAEYQTWPHGQRLSETRVHCVGVEVNDCKKKNSLMSVHLSGCHVPTQGSKRTKGDSIAPLLFSFILEVYTHRYMSLPPPHPTPATVLSFVRSISSPSKAVFKDIQEDSLTYWSINFKLLILHSTYNFLLIVPNLTSAKLVKGKGCDLFYYSS